MILQPALLYSQADSVYIVQCIDRGNRFLLKRGDYASDLDSAAVYYGMAVKRSREARLPGLEREGLCRLGERYLQVGKMAEGRQYFLEVINAYISERRQKEAADTWMRMGYTTYREGPAYGYFYTFPTRRDSAAVPAAIIQCFDTARKIYSDIGDREGALHAMRQVADIWLNQGKLDAAETGLLEVLKGYQQIGYKQLQQTFDLLSVTSRLKGNYNKALLYSMEALHSVKESGDSSALAHIFIGLGFTWHELGDEARSLQWFQQAFTRLRKDPIITPNFYRVASYIVQQHIRLDNAQAALEFIASTIREVPPYSVLDKEIVARALGDCHSAMDNHALAEKHYLEMIAWDQQQQVENEITAEGYYLMGNFYFHRGDFGKARHYANQVLSLPEGITILPRLRDTYGLLYRIDSAEGKQGSGIRNLIVFKQLNDSIFNAIKNRQLQELKVKYEAEQHEQDLTLLRNRQLLVQHSLVREKTLRQIGLAGAGMILLIAFLLYNRYRYNQKSARQLQLHQEAIHRQNVSLQQLLNEKDGLLAEKDWLLKEIHHRVRDNMEIVLQLLTVQAAHLNDGNAVKAIRDSQHRMHAMQLIHQKLFESRQLSLIDMPSFIRELADYLRNSYHTGERIQIEIEIAPVQLDISQAMPIALIINEAVSNAFKYAFPGNHGGKLQIGLQRSTEYGLELTISDNGVGIPPGAKDGSSGSFGMHLMKGLAFQLGGELVIDNASGLALAVSFPCTEMQKAV